MESEEVRKPKPFRPIVMEFEVKTKVSKGMWNKITHRLREFDSQSDYIRKLIMRDLNIDEYGNTKN